MAVHQLQGIFQKGAPVLPHRPVEGGIDGSLDDDAVPGLGEGPDGGVDAVDHTGGADNPVLLDLPAVAAGHPGADGVIVAVAPARIAPQPRAGHFLQGLDNGRGRAEFHVRHGQRHHTGLGIGAHQVPLLHLHADAGGNGLVEELIHGRHSSQ